MDQNKPGTNDFPWSPQSDEAAQLLARDEISDEKIAESVGVSRSTIKRWKQHPAFAARIDEHVAEFCRAVRKKGIAILEWRVDALNDRWRRMKQVIDERAIDPEMMKAAGGSTGLLVRKLKQIGSGENAELVEEFEVDTGLLKEMREHEKQAAQELGQWVERQTMDANVRRLDPTLEAQIDQVYGAPNKSTG